MATLCWHVISLSYPTLIYYDFLYLPYLIFICTLYPVFKFKLHLTVASLIYENSYTTFRCKLLAILKSVMYPLVKKNRLQKLDQIAIVVPHGNPSHVSL